MSKTTIVILVFIAISVVAGVFGVIFLLQRKTVDNSQAAGRTNLVNNIESLPSAAPVLSSQKYEDSSGFSFSYPNELRIYEEATNLTSAHYAYLTLESNATYGYFTAADTAYRSIDEYVFKDSKMKAAELVGATSLGGVSAKQYQKDGQMYTIAFDLGVLYVLQTPKGSGIWDQSHEHIIESFAFLNPNPTPAPVAGNPAGLPAPAGGQVIYETEVVVQ